MKRAVLYARVSSSEQAEGKFSIEIQLADMERHCLRQGDKVIKRYIDVQSGTDNRHDRANFEQMLSNARAGLFDKIVVWRPDRLFRGLTPAAKLARVLDENSIDIEAVLQPLDRNMIGLWAWVAEQELETMRQRFQGGKRANARKLGKWGGGYVPYGYRYNANKRSPDYTGKLEIDPAEAEVVRGIFEWVDGGKTASSWCQWANEDRLPTKRGGKGWTRQHLSALLRERSYTGKGAYGKLTHKGNKVVQSDDPVPLEYPAIVSQELFNKVQARLAENSKKSHGAAKRFYMLQHLGQCGECGGPVGCCTGRDRTYLYCIRQRNYPHSYHCYSPQTWPMELVEEYIWNEVMDVVDNHRDTCFQKIETEHDSLKSNVEATITKAKKELGRCSQERQRLLTTIRKGWATESEADLQFKAIKADEEQWELDLAKAEAIRANKDAVLAGIQSHLRKLIQMKDFWWYDSLNLTPEQKKEILNAVLDKFILHRDGRIELRLKVAVNEAQVADVVAIGSMSDNGLTDTARHWMG